MGVSRSIFQHQEAQTVDELLKQVSQQTGMPEDQVRPIAEAVINYLKQKLPAPVAGQIDAVLSGGGASSLGGVLGGLGGLPGQK